MVVGEVEPELAKRGSRCIADLRRPKDAVANVGSERSLCIVEVVCEAEAGVDGRRRARLVDTKAMAQTRGRNAGTMADENAPGVAVHCRRRESVSRAGSGSWHRGSESRGRSRG